MVMGREAAEGLSELAHAVRRSVALHCAIITSAEGTQDDVVYQKADEYARWIRGKAEQPKSQALGLPFNEVRF